MLVGEILLKLARDIPAYIFPPGISHLWGVGQLKIPYKRVWTFFQTTGLVAKINDHSMVITGSNGFLIPYPARFD